MRRAITLVEVLVVLLIVILLAGIISPIVAQARLEAKKTHCTSNLRQASVALNLYVEDAGGYPMMLLGENQ
jgi:type II secretory pathway pseudopilin PulG